MNNLQKETVDRLVDDARKDSSVLGLILCGSLARGTETDQSDIDLLVVVTDERFAREKATKNYFWGTDFDSNDYKVEVDGKIIPKDFLRKAWQSGNESVRSTLAHSRVIYAVDPEIEPWLGKFLNVPLDKAENMIKFYSMMKSSRYSADENSDNLLWINKCIVDTVFYACRLVLAHNDMLYPCVKNILKELKNCSMMPENFPSLMDDLLQSRSSEKLALFYNIVDLYFSELHLDNKLRKGYVIENEWFWYFYTLPYDEI